MISWRQAALSGVRSGTVAAITSTFALLLCGWIERRRPAAPINGPSQWVLGEGAAHETHATLRHTFVGYAIHHAMSILWSVVHERVYGDVQRRPAVALPIVAGLTTAAIAAFVDYRIAPKRLQPGFDKHLSRKSLVAVYAAFGIGLALRGICRTKRHREKK